jgi:hypothetical protein
MKPTLNLLLICCLFCLCSSAGRAQSPIPATPPAPVTALQSVFETDSRTSVRAFKEPLEAFYADSQNPAAASSIPSDLGQLRLAANARTATSMWNIGMQVLDLKAAFRQIVSGLSQVRPEKQLSAQATSSGTTSLVSKAGGSSILALAVDAGALTSTTSGTSTTVSGNLEGIGSLLMGQSPISIDPTKQNGLRAIAGSFTLQATFNLNQPSTKTTTATQPGAGTSPPAGTQVSIPSSVGKLTGLTAQFLIHNPFDPHSQTFRTNWNATKADLQTAAKAVLDATDPLVGDLDCPACQADWVKAKSDLAAAAASRNPQIVADVFDNYVNTVVDHAKAADPDFSTKVVSAAKTIAAYQQVVHTAIDKTLGNLFALEYDFGKPLNQPETHDFKLVYGYAMNSTSAINSLLTSASGAKSLFSANANISIYGGTIPVSAKYGRLHYGQVSAEFDTPVFGGSVKQGVFTLAGYWQYQPSPSVLNITQGDVAPGTSIPAPTQVLVGTAGSLFVAQAKITIKDGKSGIAVPIGIKWSNKSDLLSGSKVGGQIGISYDFSTLSGLFGGGN